MSSKEIANAFRAAKGFLQTGHETGGIRCGSRFICFAIADATQNRSVSWAAAFDAGSIITQRLGENNYIEGWVYANIPGVRELRESCDDAHFRSIMQDYRHRWLDSLIEEFSGK